VDSKLRIRASKVSLDRSAANVKLITDLTSRVALGRQANDLELSPG
jgi:hypothetical protein